MRSVRARHVNVEANARRARRGRCGNGVTDEGARNGASTVRLGDAEQVDVGLRTARSHPALRGTSSDRVANDLTLSIHGHERPTRVEVVHRVVPPQRAQRRTERLLEGLHMDGANLVLRNLVPRQDAVSVTRGHGHLAAGQVAVHDLVRALSEEAGRNVEAATIGHVRVDEVRNRGRNLRIGSKFLDEHLSGASVLPVEQSPAHASATPVRVDEGADDGGGGLVNAAQHAHGRHRADVSLRVQADDRVHPVAPVLALHHVRNVVDGGTPNGVVVVFDQGDKRVHGGGIAADHGPPAQPEVIARVRDGPGRRESLRKSCHGRYPTGYSGL